MSGTGLFALLPVIVVAATSVLLTLALPLRPRHGTVAGLAGAGLILALASMVPVGPVTPQQVTPLLIVDGYGLFFGGLILAAALAVVAMSYGYLRGRPVPHGEYYLLVLLAVLGALTLVGSSHFASFLIGLELLSVSLFALIAYPAALHRPLEAGVKYLVLAGVSSAFLLFGLALLYARFGTMEFARLGTAVGTGPGILGDIYLFAGLALVVVGVGFKLSLVPFHMWVADVYEGAPAPVTAFLATVSKGAMFALLLRYFIVGEAYAAEPIALVFSVIAIASMLAGNVLALLQDNVKRILAYSSVAHLGYLLVAFLVAGAFAVEAVGFYLTAYFVTTLGAFGIVSLLSTGEAEGEVDRLDEYEGLFWRRPWTAAAFTAMLLSLAGLPLTAGFIAKFYLVTAGVSAALWTLVIVLVAGSAIGLFYYLRVIVRMFATPGTQKEPVFKAPVSANITLLALTVLLVFLGLYPQPLIGLIELAAIG